jgi:para-aminobenzoate synthetase component 1
MSNMGDLSLKYRLLAWANRQETAVFLDNNEYPSIEEQGWECLAAVGVTDAVAVNTGSARQSLRQLRDRNPGKWLLGYLAYDLKNEVEDLSSSHFDALGWPDLFFFCPETVVGIRAGKLIVFDAQLPEMEIKNAIVASLPVSPFFPENSIILEPRISKEVYLYLVEAIRGHIGGGDIYEMNFCQEFYAENVDIDPAGIFVQLNEISRAPFATFFKNDHLSLICGSPERFLQKKGEMLVTQPIKGTRKRSADPLEDAAIREELFYSEKDRSENVMIVDLVRNDLSRNCLPGTVIVDELFGIYSFPTVHQMISTVRGTLPAGDDGLDALFDAFPMGSMTGAPKVMAMQLIEQYETTRRGLYSGAVGYFAPNGDFDFNVVIRSLQYNAKNKYLSCSVGGAIVYDSVPEQEYEECLVKIAAIRKTLEGKK